MLSSINNFFKSMEKEKDLELIASDIGFDVESRALQMLGSPDPDQMVISLTYQSCSAYVLSGIRSPSMTSLLDNCSNKSDQQDKSALPIPVRKGKVKVDPSMNHFEKAQPVNTNGEPHRETQSILSRSHSFSSDICLSMSSTG